MYTENIYCTTIVSDNEDGYASMNGDVVFYYDKAEGEQKGSLKLWCSADTTKLKYTDWSPPTVRGPRAVYNLEN